MNYRSHFYHESLDIPFRYTGSRFDASSIPASAEYTRRSRQELHPDISLISIIVGSKFSRYIAANIPHDNRCIAGEARNRWTVFKIRWSFSLWWLAIVLVSPDSTTVHMISNGHGDAIVMQNGNTSRLYRFFRHPGSRVLFTSLQSSPPTPLLPR